jgi:predicted ABC-type exoprotein transport system permease subunit
MNTGKKYKTVYGYIVNADSLNLPDVIPQSQLQLDEVDWAGFLDYEEASTRIMFKQFSLLTHIQNEQENNYEKSYVTTINNTSKQETKNGNNTLTAE